MSWAFEAGGWVKIHLNALQGEMQEVSSRVPNFTGKFIPPAPTMLPGRNPPAEPWKTLRQAGRRRRKRRRRRPGSHPSGSDPEQKHEQKMQEQ